jgi:hypothetical protein
MESLALSPHTDNVPEYDAAQGGVLLSPWLISHGLPPSSFTVLPRLSHNELASLLPLMNAAVFPNRYASVHPSPAICR